MNDVILLVIRHALGIWRYRWYAILAAWVTCIGGWIFVYQLPFEYKSAAKIHVDTQTLFRPMLRGIAITGDVGERVRLMTRVLLSRPNLEKLMRTTDLDLNVASPEANDRLVESLHERIKIDSNRREKNVYTISVTDEDPLTAKNIVQALLTTFIEGSLGDARADTDSAQEFLDRQIADYERRLSESELSLANFKRKNVGFLPGADADYYGRLQSQQALLNGAELDLEEAKRRRDGLTQRLNDANPGDDEVPDDSNPEGSLSANIGDDISSLKPRIAELEVRLDNLLLTYTERHPDVVELRRLIGRLEEQREAASRDGSPSRLGDALMQQIELMLLQTNAEVAAIEARVAEYRSRTEALQEMVDTVPQIEAELARLNRDYSVTKTNFSKLLQRREGAQLGERAERSGGDVQFRVLEPPRVPLEPVAPNRLLLISLVFVAGVGAGVGIGWLVSQIRPVVLDSRMVTEVTGLPVLGTVTMTVSSAVRSRQIVGVTVFGLACMSLLSSYCLGVASEVLGLDIHTRVAGVFNSL